ncbi:MAG: fluoride efflux transporter CrcB [Planctomycetota bacterium]|nr:fluoride efflux transporter CrcB [Planctomycetota bacterium]
MTLVQALLVAAGGAVGSVARFALSRGAVALVGASFPWGTLAVNVLGCAAAGVLLGAASRDQGASPARLFLVTGVLGGFTTFSAFGAETVALAQRGQWGGAGLNVLANVVLGLGAAGLGFVLARP